MYGEPTKPQSTTSITTADGGVITISDWIDDCVSFPPRTRWNRFKWFVGRWSGYYRLREAWWAFKHGNDYAP